MGLTTRDRQPKPAFRTVQKMFRAAPYFPLPRCPRVSVVVASYNGERTLKACLDSLDRLNYPDYEVILVDDGSTDTTRQIAFAHPNVRYFRHEKNLGLSVARNTGIAAATGEIVAFTDSDCRADEDWLYYLVGDLLESEFAGIGGPNLLPPEDSLVAAAVMASPGGPAHVMLTDRQAEHIPGCNMAFYKWALAQVGGFDPIFHRAGDDVDLCWRLQQAGLKIGFSPAAFVWHYRRSTVRRLLATAARLRRGGGPAGAQAPGMLQFLWRQPLAWADLHHFQASATWVRPPIIYRGLFGSAGFQFLYASQPAFNLMVCTTLGVSRAGDPAAVGDVGDLPSPAADGHHQPADLGRCVRGGRRTGRLAPDEAALVVASARGDAVLPPADRARLGALPGPLVAAAHTAGAAANARFHRAARQQAIAARSQLLGRAAPRPAGVRGRYPAPAGPAGLAEQVRHRLERLRRRGSRHAAGASCNSPPWPKSIPEGKQLIRCRLRARWALRTRVAFWSLCGLELLICGLLGRRLPWLWLLLLTLPLFVWFIRRQQRNLQSMMVVFLDELAKEWRLAKVPPQSGQQPPSERTSATLIASAGRDAVV